MEMKCLSLILQKAMFITEQVKGWILCKLTQQSSISVTIQIVGQLFLQTENKWKEQSKPLNVDRLEISSSVKNLLVFRLRSIQKLHKRKQTYNNCKKKI